MKKFNFKRMLCVAMAICIMASMAVPTFAYDTLTQQGNDKNHSQRTTSSTIDTSLTGSIELYKIDFTNAEKDGKWNNDSYVSTGIYDKTVNDTLIDGAVRNGDDKSFNPADGTIVEDEGVNTGASFNGQKDVLLGNGQISNGYAIKGVVFSYLKVAEIAVYSEAEAGVNKNMVLYGFPSTTASQSFLSCIGLKPENAYITGDLANGRVVKGAGTGYYFFESDKLVNALRQGLLDNPTNVKNALEAYMADNSTAASKMPETDSNGYTSVSGLPLGLYIIVETSVPEHVTCTTNPFFVSLPMTTVDGTNSGVAQDGDDSNSTDGGASWLYDITLYPKNETGIFAMEKTVRESAADTGENQSLNVDTDSNTNLAIKDGYGHYATASSGDTLEYQIIVTLPSITSDATGLSVMNLTDVLTKGMTYSKENSDLLIEWFRDENCTDKITTWTAGKQFKVDYVPASNEDTQDITMKITMTTEGLREINTANTVWHTDGADNQVRRGYSDCTMRLTYSAKLDSNASVTYGEIGNANTVILEWRRSNDAYYDTLVDDAHVYTFGLDLTKLFEQEAAQVEWTGNFDEVEFVLWNKNDGYWVEAALNADEGVYYVTNHLYADGTEGHDDDGKAGNDTKFGANVVHDKPVDHAGLTAQESAAKANATKFVPVTTGTATNKNEKEGRVIIKGLEDDTYILTEIRTANGYTLLKNSIEIVISTSEIDELCDIYTTDMRGVVQNDPRYATVVNANNVGTYMGLGGVVADNGTVTGQNIPQEQMSHHLLKVAATVDGNAVNMLPDEYGVDGVNNDGNYADGVQGSVEVNGVTKSANALVPLTVVNTQGFDLPQTGELGIILMPLAGMLGICACCFFLFVMRKKEQEENVA